jgi:hypothetical protein
MEESDSQIESKKRALDDSADGLPPAKKAKLMTPEQLYDYDEEIDRLLSFKNGNYLFNQKT